MINDEIITREIIEAYLYGVQVKEIVRLFGVSERKLYKILHSNNIELRSHNKKATPYTVLNDTTVLHIEHSNTVWDVCIDTTDLSKVLLASRRWYILQGTHAKYVYYSSKKEGSTYLHRLVTDAPPGVEVDHINHDTLDNRKSNLRICDSAENKQNQAGAHRDSVTGVRGVSYISNRSLVKPYYARIQVKGRVTRLGYFNTLSEADEAIKRARKELMPFSIEARR